MPYIDRDQAGNITGIYTVAQHEGHEFIDGEVSLYQPIIVPSTVTMRQARLALLAAGKLQDVENAINALPDPPKTAARIEWDYSNEVQRHNGFVASLAPILNMSEADLDKLFILAATL
jgi:hypothetical protein